MSLTDIPFDVKSYCEEVGKRLSDEQIALIARPKTLTPLQQELMYWHEKLYHLPFHRLIALANKGILPSQLSKCRNDAPIRISCQFGQAHKCPWRSKGKRSNPIRKITDNKVGDCVSTDQLVSAQPGLIPQMNGFLTNERILGVAIFVNQETNFTYVHLMRDISLQETLQAKQAFEKLVAQRGGSVK